MACDVKLTVTIIIFLKVLLNCIDATKFIVLLIIDVIYFWICLAKFNVLLPVTYIFLTKPFVAKFIVVFNVWDNVKARMVDPTRLIVNGIAMPIPLPADIAKLMVVPHACSCKIPKKKNGISNPK